VIDRLDYIASLGIDAIWFNPCFASPFFDAGYDVADYLRIAPRYGTNDDLVELVEKAGARGIRILLDLVVGHTSIEHPWFQHGTAGRRAESLEGDRYVWSDRSSRAGLGHRSALASPAGSKSPGPRPGWYLKNFYEEQPALNFGWVAHESGGRAVAATPSTRPVPDAQSRWRCKRFMDFWLSRGGVAGFRVDMAFSLVKDEVLSDGHSLLRPKIWQRPAGVARRRHTPKRC
jgi:glycosidase